MLISIITLFPQMFSGIFSESITKRAIEKGKLKIHIVDLREFGIGTHKQVDDTPYGGGTGMVLRVDVLDHAIQKTRHNIPNEKVFLLDPKGKPYSQSIAENLTQLDHIILICGRYEGFDERIRALVDMEISLGDFVLSGGEIAAMAITESVMRLLPGVLKESEATQLESFSEKNGFRLLEFPHYTKPQTYKPLDSNLQEMCVPEVLLSGHAKKIEEYRAQEAQTITQDRRPDLLTVSKN